MAHINGMYVALETAKTTDSHIYIGVSGSDGGREFTLATAGEDDFDAGSNVMYELGNTIGVYRRPDGAEPGGYNDPTPLNIDLAGVWSVYLRKQPRGGSGHSDDDDYQLGKVTVWLYNLQEESRRFEFDAGGNGLLLGNQYGHQVWLREVG